MLLTGMYPCLAVFRKVNIDVRHSVLNPNEADVDPAELEPSASPTVAFSNASSVSALPFTSAVISPVTTLAVPAWVTEAPALNSEQTAAPSSSASVAPAEGAAVAMATAAPVMVGAIALGALLL